MLTEMSIPNKKDSEESFLNYRTNLRLAESNIAGRNSAEIIGSITQRRSSVR